MAETKTIEQTIVSNPSYPLSVTINDEFIGEATTEDLESAKLSISQAYQKLESELTHRSDDQKSKSSNSSSDFPSEVPPELVEIFVKLKIEHPQVIDSLVSPRFDDLFKNHFRWLPELVDSQWTRIFTAILPSVFFSVISLIFILLAGRINSGVVFGTLVVGILSFVLGFYLLRLLSEARKYNLQEKIKKNLKHSLSK